MSQIKQEVIDARINKGWTFSAIYDTYGVPKSTAQGWLKKHFDESVEEETVKEPTLYQEYKQGYVVETMQRDKPQKFKKTEDEVFAFLEQLAPIKVNSLNNNSVSYVLNEYAVVGSDFHFGCHDESAINIFLETIAELQPQTIVLNGDTMDMLAISKYPKDIKKHWSLLDERKAYHQLLDDLISISNGAKIYETVSNHSGQSIDGRWRRYLSDRLGELGCLPEITDRLSYQNVFMGDYQNKVEHVDYVDLNGLIVTHGTTVRAAGGASAKGEIEKWHTSILHGHTHRIGSSCKRIPAFGNRPDKQIYGFEGGALCSLDAVYSSTCNWQQGFNIIALNDDSFGVEQVMINSGVANISTLGKTICG
jgi:hypothetical protein